MGWLRSVPERNKKDDRRSRFEQYGADHPYTSLPDIDGVEYMADMFVDSGISSQGPAPLTWQELDAYNRCNSLGITPWEFQRLMEMSRAYCQWNIKGSKQSDIADDVPHIDETRKATGYIHRTRDVSAKKAEDAKSGKLE